MRSVEELLGIYYSSVGGNATFLLNIPPDKRGLFHESDVARLKELGDAIRAAFPCDLVLTAMLSASDSLDDVHDPQCAADGDKSTYWRPADGVEQLFGYLIDMLCNELIQRFVSDLDALFPWQRRLKLYTHAGADCTSQNAEYQRD